MIKKILSFVLIGLLFISCAEKEDPETVFGLYLPEYITSDRPIDFTGNGIVSLDLLDQLIKNKTGRIFAGPNSGTIFLNLYSPEYFNVHFSQVLLRLPHHYEFENKVYLEFYQNGRRVDKESNGTLTLSWNTYPYQFEFPEQIHEDIVIESLKTNSGKNNNVELVTSQRLFDHSKKEWVKAKVTYTFRKDGPCY
jgi:hypothetical protein